MLKAGYFCFSNYFVTAGNAGIEQLICTCCFQNNFLHYFLAKYLNNSEKYTGINSHTPKESNDESFITFNCQLVKSQQNFQLKVPAKPTI